MKANAICRECEVGTYDPDEESYCANCAKINAEIDGELEAEERYRDGLADYAEHLGDSVRDGDMTMSQARSRYAAVARRRR